jgi:hypothetical protein
MSARRVFQPSGFLWLAPALFGLLASPGAARAGCGDHAHPTAAGLDISLASLARLDGPRDLPSPTEPSRPCTGPSCSQRRHEAPTAALPAPHISPERGLVALRVEPPRVPGVRLTLGRRLPAYEPPSLDLPDRPPRP